LAALAGPYALPLRHVTVRCRHISRRQRLIRCCEARAQCKHRSHWACTVLRIIESRSRIGYNGIIYRRYVVPMRKLPIDTHFCCTMYRLARKHSEQLKLTSISNRLQFKTVNE